MEESGAVAPLSLYPQFPESSRRPGAFFGRYFIKNYKREIFNFPFCEMHTIKDVCFIEKIKNCGNLKIIIDRNLKI